MKQSTTKTELQTAAALQFHYLRTELIVFTKLAVINPGFCGSVLNSVDSSFSAADLFVFTAGDSFGIVFVLQPSCW